MAATRGLLGGLDSIRVASTSVVRLNGVTGGFQLPVEHLQEPVLKAGLDHLEARLETADHALGPIIAGSDIGEVVEIKRH
jgi:hypothetical protein